MTSHAATPESAVFHPHWVEVTRLYGRHRKANRLQFHVELLRQNLREGRSRALPDVTGVAQDLNVAGGSEAWQASGMPIVTDDGRPGTVA